MIVYGEDFGRLWRKINKTFGEIRYYSAGCLEQNCRLFELPPILLRATFT